MDKDNLINLINEKGWKITRNDMYLGRQFDIIGEKKFIIFRWSLLVKFTDRITKEHLSQIKNEFTDLSDNSKSWIWGKCFIYCVIANSIDPSITDEIKGDNFGLFGILRLKGGGGRIFIADTGKKRIYGDVPSLPYDAHKHSREIFGIIEKMM